MKSWFPPKAPVALATGLTTLILLRLAVTYISFPLTWLSTINVVVSVAFVLISVFTLYLAASWDWTWSRAVATIGVGLAMQFGIGALSRYVPYAVGAILHPISQSGLLIWCLGMGAALCLALRKDRNMLIPVAIFLAIFDIWLVFVPEGPVGQIARGNQEALAQVAFTVPRPTAAPTGGRAADLAYIGPADFLFMSMFFVALYRFGLRVHLTARWMAVALVVYLLIALKYPHLRIGPITLGALPALVPIALVVLAVNWREFRLSRDEKLTCAFITAVSIAVVAWRFTVSTAAQPGPSPGEPGPGHVAPAGSPPPIAPN